MTLRPVLRSYQERLSSSVAVPSCTMRLPDRSSGSASPRFSRQRRTRAASSLPMMIRASEPPMKDLLLQSFNAAIWHPKSIRNLIWIFMSKIDRKESQPISTELMEPPIFVTFLP